MKINFAEGDLVQLELKDGTFHAGRVLIIDNDKELVSLDQSHTYQYEFNAYPFKDIKGVTDIIHTRQCDA